jgi:aryl-alcohol dehydrogenase-like predicted oxidoreductase
LSSSSSFGATGLRVSRLGLGAGHIGGDDLDEREVARLLHGALDAGVTLIDTARGYGKSEERIARHLGGRRDELVLSTKGGYGVEGVPDWTAEAVTRGVEAALTTLRTDRIDVFHLHSCPREILERGEVVRALSDAVRAGKVRVAAYSGENEALEWAVSSGCFGSLQCSVNLVDQRSLDGAIAEAARRGLGVIGKRPLANACWRFDARPIGDYAEVYWERLATLRDRLGAVDWPNLAVRFAAFAPGVSSVIVGTRSLEHLHRSLAAVDEGPLPAAMVDELRAWFRANDRGWLGQI